MSGQLPSLVSAYADVIIQVGLNLRPGQRLLIVGSSLYGVDITLAPFVRLVAERAYANGAAYVDVLWWDPLLDLVRLRHARRDSLDAFPEWFGRAQMEYHQAADAFLVIYAEDPHLFAGIPPDVVSAHLGGIRPTVAEARELRARNALNWCVVSAPVPAWAAAVFPDEPPEVREDRLWELILSVCRADEPDPTAAWRAHVRDLTARAAYLTRKRFASLKYSGPGTRLTVGLPSGHVWHGGQMQAANGIDFVANLPTEEVFTSPDCRTAEGSVSATRPFQYGGNSIEDMKLTFAGGKVVEYAARVGEPILRELLQAGPGSDRLGEVALVPHSSPVSQTRVVFRNLLFDENAACHLALGSAYRFCLAGAAEETEEQFAQRGGNVSQLHYDFMIGSDALDVDGITETGAAEPIMRNGEWAFAP